MNLYTDASSQMIKNLDAGLSQKINIPVLKAGHEKDARFMESAEQLDALCSNLSFIEQETENPLPGFLLADNIHFCALPLEKELEPFLNALSLLNEKPPVLDPSLEKECQAIQVPVQLTLYIALMCPHCPGMVNSLIPPALNNPNIHLTIIDGSLFSDLAQKNNVLSAPCLILDDDFRWTGQVPAGEILNHAANRDPSKLSVASLKNIIEQGDASWITRQMVSEQKIFDAFISLLINDKWSVRLGAMVIVEELAEEDPGLGEKLCPILIQLFDRQEPSVQGDILYALGCAGSLETKQWIEEKLTHLSGQELVEAAEEAVETIIDKH